MNNTRISIWILGDQLMVPHPALTLGEQLTHRDNLRVVMIENAARMARRPCHRKKLTLLLSAMRHYAADLRAAGYAVDYLQADSLRAGLGEHLTAWQPERLLTMAASEYAGRVFQQQTLSELVDGPVTVLPNSHFLITRRAQEQGRDQADTGGKGMRMETFYRSMRRHFDVLMDGEGEPAGGKWNFDHENRKPLPKAGLHPPPPISFRPDAITEQVMDEVAAFAPALGEVAGFDLAVTRAEAEAAFEDFLSHRLADFGAYEDAMSHDEPLLFHSRLSPYMNLGLLDPMEMVRQAERAYRSGKAPINSVEGFIRQILGWREYIYWQYWRLMPGLRTANSWGHTRPLPGYFWTGATDMHCLGEVIRRVLESGYSHHIERLMILCNFAMLTGVDPGTVNEWFLSLYVDAYEWVVTPNVIGMGLNADGGETATKPYISSANYINKMSDFCTHCRLDPKQRVGERACPFNFLYWNFLLENEATLRANPRFGPAVLGLRHLDAAEREAVREQAASFLNQRMD